MGMRSENGLEVEARSAFAVPHSEGEDQVAVDMPFQQQMVSLFSRAGPKEVVIGWCVETSYLTAVTMADIAGTRPPPSSMRTRRCSTTISPASLHHTPPFTSLWTPMSLRKVKASVSRDGSRPS